MLDRKEPVANPDDAGIDAIDARLSALEVEKACLLERRRNLLERKVSSAHPQLTPAQKVSLFQRLFRGRADIYATRWQNSQGRSGYAIACHNEWVPGVCQKPKVKCGDCANRRFKVLDAQAVYDHLSGNHIAGIYPLLPDNSCHCLAMDFDKADWQNVIKALAYVCRENRIPYGIEISRSGNGAHLWIFFSGKVQASTARKLGFMLLDKAMEIHPGLSFDCYDRLFPNQDMMPNGGFGNLIALPLQQEARQLGNTLFVDDHLAPYDDQWAFLSQLTPLPVGDVHKIVQQLAPEVCHSSVDSITAVPPWEQNLKIDRSRIADCPKKLTIILANQVYIALEAVPAPLAARLKRVASFANPVFFKTQALRFSTHGIPRYITCARIEHGYLSLPRGCLDEVLALLEEQAISVEFEDKRSVGRTLENIHFSGELRADQYRAVFVLKTHESGILHAPTAFGKTVTAMGVIVERKVSTLILTHSRQLLDQWKERLGTFLTGVEVGTIGGGKKSPTGQIDIATYQSLINKKDNSISDVIHNYGQVIIDECHHISAPRYEMLLNEIRARYVLGLTATPDRQDGHQKIMFMAAGPVRHKVQPDSGAKFEQLVIVNQRFDHLTVMPAPANEKPHISAVYRGLAENEQRNRQIIGDVLGAVSRGEHCLLLTERRAHAEALSRTLDAEGILTVVLRGAMQAGERKAAISKLKDAQVVVATGKYVGEGFDLPRLNTLFLALPISWKGSLAQYAGRIHREVQGKDKVTIYDYVDCALPMLQRMYQKRERGYKAMGYAISPRLL